MLQLDNGQRMMDDLWEAAPTKVELPDSLKQSFFREKGKDSTNCDNQRTYDRYFMRGKAILKRGKTMLGAYTKDVSRQGVAFLSPVPLQPKERVKLRVPAAELSLEVTRCRRLDTNCFECGAKFSTGRDG